MRHRLALVLVLAVAGLGATAGGCGGGGGGGLGAPPLPSVGAIVLDYADDPGRDLPVEVVGGPSGRVRTDGLVVLGPVTPGRHLLRVGDSRTTPTIYVPFTQAAEATFLDRPVYLPALESGIGANLPATITTDTTISGPALPGVSLTLATGTAVTLPAGAATEVRVLGVSPSRLPAGAPVGAGEPRAAFMIEPSGVAFAPRATLSIPRQDALGAGPFDAFEVSPATGEWILLATGVAPVGTDTFALDVVRGTLVCVVPRAASPRVTLTGRVLAGTTPAAGFRASCWGRTSSPTAADGTFTIPDVPTSYGVFYVRVHPARPGVDFAPRVSSSTATSPALGDLVVAAAAPDGLRPTVRATSPQDGAQDVDPGAQVLVTFSEPIDRNLTEAYEVRGRLGKLAGRLTFDSAFAVRFIPTKALEPSDHVSIVVDANVRDLAGNTVDDHRLVTGFVVRAGTPAAPPTDTLAFSVSPLAAGRGDTLSIVGRNFTGGSTVKVGATVAIVTLEAQDEIQATVPDFQPAGDVTVSVTAGGTAVATLRPLGLDLRGQVAAVFSGTTKDVPLVVVDRAAPPPVIVVDGANVGGASVTVDGVAIAAVDSTVTVGAGPVATGRLVSLPTPAPPTLLSGPVVVRGQNGKAGVTYRFLLVRE